MGLHPQIRRWILLTHCLACQDALLMSESFLERPNKRALKNRALGIVETAIAEIKEFSPVTACTRLEILEHLADTLNGLSFVLFPRCPEKAAQDCSLSDLIEFERALRDFDSAPMDISP